MESLALGVTIVAISGCTLIVVSLTLLEAI